MKKMIAPTLACADLMNVSKDIQILDEMGVCTYHIDIMDQQCNHSGINIVDGDKMTYIDFDE